MSQDAVQRFIDALGRLESGGDVEPLVEQFADDCELSNVTLAGAFEGKDGARRFWSDDRGIFGEIRSEFRSVIVSDGRAALEWTRTGTGRDGDEVHYPGVSILELGDGGITRFAAYYHPRELGRQAL